MSAADHAQQTLNDPLLLVEFIRSYEPPLDNLSRCFRMLRQAESELSRIDESQSIYLGGVVIALCRLEKEFSDRLIREYEEA